MGKRILFWVFVLIIIPLMLVSILVYYQGKQIITKQIYTTLNVAADSLEAQLLFLLETKKSRVLSFSSDGFILENLRKITQQPKSIDFVNAINQHLREHTTGLDPDIVEIFILNREGKFVVSTSKEHLKSEEVEPEHFLKGKKRITIGTIESKYAERHFSISAPLTDKRTGDFLGVITILFRASAIDNILTGETARLQGAETVLGGLNRQGKMYLVGRDKTIIAGMPELLGRHCDTDIIRHTFSTGKEMVEEDISIFGKQMIESSMYLKEPGWVVIASIPKKEIFAPLQKLTFMAFLFISIGVIVVIRFTVASTNRVSRWILKVASTAERIAKGNWDERIEIKEKKGEIAQLVNTFNQMVAKLHESFIQQKRAEHEVRQSEEKYRMLVQNIDEIVYAVVFKPGENLFEGKVEFVSNKVKRILGYSSEDFIQKPDLWMQLIHPEDLPLVAESTQKLITTKSIGTRMYRLRLKDTNEFIWVEDNVVPKIDDHDNIIGIFGVARDITERKQAEAELKARAFQQSVVAELGQRALMVIDLSTLLDETVVIVSKTLGVEYCKVLELLPEGNTLLLRAGIGWKEGFVGHATVDAKENSQAVYTLHSNEPVVVEDFSSETRFPPPPLLCDHGVVSGMSVVIHGQYGPFGVLGAHTTKRRTFSKEDIHFLRAIANLLGSAIERKRAEENVKLAIKEWETTFNSITDLVSINDKNFKNIRVNRAYADAFRVKQEELIGKTCCEIIHGTKEPRTDCPHKRVLETRKSTREEFFEPHLGIHIEESVSPVFNEQREVVGSVHVIKNITERKKLEEQFRQSQKMEAVGRLAGGVAHDFNNILTAIYGYSEMLFDKLAEGDPLRKYVNEINNAGQRAASLTRQLLAFSRKQVIQPEVLALNAVVTGMKEMIRRLIGEDIELVIIPGAELGRVKADTGQLEQVIMNLAVNSRDAMPKGGKITIETANVEIDEAFARSHFPVKPGSYVMLAVSDTGCGMDKETQAHIFEPFFTTKEVGKGTGLGLSTVYGIVKQSKGYIFVNSESGQGTCFEVYLPRIEEALKSLEPSTIPRISFQGSETILLVEDEEAVQQLVCEILRKNGYTVLEAHHGGEALLVCERHKGPIHLMLTDVVMPMMSGRELVKRLEPLRPEMKVLYMSGYTDGAFVQKGELEPGISILQKPFTIDILTSRVRETLDK